MAMMYQLRYAAGLQTTTTTTGTGMTMASPPGISSTGTWTFGPAVTYGPTAVFSSGRFILLKMDTVNWMTHKANLISKMWDAAAISLEVGSSSVEIQWCSFEEMAGFLKAYGQPDLINILMTDV